MTLAIPRSAGLIALAALMLSACGAEPPPPPAPTTVALSVEGRADMNGGAPARVKVYYLNSDAAFRNADFFSLFEDPQAALGPDLVAVDEYLLTPGGSEEAAKSFDAAVPFIGAVAGLRDIDRPGWKATSPLEPRAPNPIRLTLDGQGAKFEAVEGAGTEE